MDDVRFRLLVARTDTDAYAVVYAMDETVIDVAGEDEWNEQVADLGWPDEYDYATLTVTIPADAVATAFPPKVEVEARIESAAAPSTAHSTSQEVVASGDAAPPAGETTDA